MRFLRERKIANILRRPFYFALGRCTVVPLVIRAVYVQLRGRAPWRTEQIANLTDPAILIESSVLVPISRPIGAAGTAEQWHVFPY